MTKKSKRRRGPQFQPLDVGKPQIRILLLCPGKRDQPIVCTHETISLEEPTDYEALSYCWGSPENPRKITLNGMPFDVSPALEVALLHLRQENRVRRLWIDAICINQGHNEEKMHQIQQMRSVYQSASQVFVWLGPAYEGSDATFRLIEKIATEDIEIPVGSMPHITRLLDLPYWERMWILQEIVVASKDPLVGCGEMLLPLRTFGIAVKKIESALFLSFEATQRHFESVGSQEFNYSRTVLQRINYLLIKRDAHHYHESNAEASPRGFPSEDSNKRTLNWIYLLDETRVRVTSDHRDRIYALLGLCSIGNKPFSTSEYGLSPDYTKSHWRVYQEATKLAIEHCNELEVLHFKNHLNHPELPSWVPDFSKHYSQTFRSLVRQQGNLWSASGPLQNPYETKFRVSLDLETLFATGGFIDSIEHVVSLQKIDNSFEEVIREIHEAVSDSIAEGSVLNASGHRYLVDAIWTSLVNNFFGVTPPMPRSKFLAVYLAIVDPRRGRCSGPNVTTFKLAVSDAIKGHATCKSLNRTFFISKTGYVGLGTPDCQKGDSIAILYGYSMPVILRPMRRCQRLLGSVYVHGIMNGEALPFKQEEIFTIR